MQQKRALKDLADLRRDVAGDVAAEEARSAALAGRLAALEARPAAVDALAAAAGDQLAALAAKVPNEAQQRPILPQRTELLAS